MRRHLDVIAVWSACVPIVTDRDHTETWLITRWRCAPTGRKRVAAD